MTDTTNEPNVYDVPPQNLSWLLHRLTLLNRRADRLGVPRVTWTVGATIQRRKLDKVSLYCPVTVHGETPRLNGWRLVAVLLHEDGTIIRAVPGTGIDLKAYREARPTCEHCNTHRPRLETFVLAHEDATLRQVGRNCLEDFLGGKGPHDMAATAEIVIEASELGWISESMGGGSSGSPCVSLGSFLENAVAVIREHGWVPRSGASEAGRIASAERINSQVFGKSRSPVKVTDEDKTKAEHYLKIAKTKLAAEGADLNEYEYNLAVIVERDYVTPPTSGLAASLVGYAQRLEAVEVEKRLAATGVLRHVGAVGEKIVWNLTLVSARTFETQYGTATYCNFRDESGNHVVWKASGCPDVTTFGDPGCDQDDLTVYKPTPGEQYEVAATIKAHEQDRKNELPVTKLTRAVIGRPGRLARIAKVKAEKKAALAVARREAREAKKKAAKEAAKEEAQHAPLA